MRNEQATQLLFDLSVSGRCGAEYPESDCPEFSSTACIPAEFLSDTPLPLPDVNEPDVIRHFTNLSTLNM